jgi:hypothetical protein
MLKTKWEKVADREFRTLDKEWQADWIDLRKRVNRS